MEFEGRPFKPYVIIRKEQLMKKLACFMLTVLMIFSFMACQKENNESEKNTIDLEYYAKLGQIPECDYMLGDSVNKVKSELSALDEKYKGENGFVYMVQEGEKTVEINNGDYLYFYTKDNEANGISYIVNLGTAFGFEPGTVSIEITDALSAYEYTEEEANDDNTFFLPDFTNCTVFKYEFDNHVVSFVFQDNALCATAVYDSANWTV